MDTPNIEGLGPRFAFAQAEELDLMVDLLFRRNDHLGVCLAYASFVQQSPGAVRQLRLSTRNIVQGSLDQLMVH